MDFYGVLLCTSGRAWPQKILLVRGMVTRARTCKRAHRYRGRPSATSFSQTRADRNIEKSKLFDSSQFQATSALFKMYFTRVTDVTVVIVYSSWSCLSRCALFSQYHGLDDCQFSVFHRVLSLVPWMMNPGGSLWARAASSAHAPHKGDWETSCHFCVFTVSSPLWQHD